MCGPGRRDGRERGGLSPSAAAAAASAAKMGVIAVAVGDAAGVPVLVGCRRREGADARYLMQGGVSVHIHSTFTLKYHIFTRITAFIRLLISSLYEYTEVSFILRKHI